MRSVLEKYWSSPVLHRFIDRDPGKVHKHANKEQYQNSANYMD